MREKLMTLITGVVGAGAIEATESLKGLTPEDVQAGTTIVSQIIILALTLWRLFKKKSKPD